MARRCHVGVDPQTKAGIVANTGAGIDRTLHTRSSCRASEGGVCIRNSSQRSARVEVLNAAFVVDVNAQQRSGFDVAQVVSAEHHAVPDFTLDSDVHLH